MHTAFIQRIEKQRAAWGKDRGFPAQEVPNLQVVAARLPGKGLEQMALAGSRVAQEHNTASVFMLRKTADLAACCRNLAIDQKPFLT
nr:hypothetical protein FFPRI1PSEUD_35020 [Pseudomonas sp. FFPRI_1]